MSRLGSAAKLKMQNLRKMRVAIEDAPTLAQTRELARTLSRQLRTRKIEFPTRVWNDLGALKLTLKNAIASEQNAFARKVMDRVEHELDNNK